MELRTRPTVGISVGGGRGVVEYGHGETAGVELRAMMEAERWLGVQIRPDLEH
jgi:hypothetical protein